MRIGKRSRVARLAKVESAVKKKSPFVESSSSLKRITGTWQLVVVGPLVGTIMLGLEGVEIGLGDV